MQPDKIHPSIKPPPPYNNIRRRQQQPPPPSHHHHRCRRGCCLCFLYTVILLLSIILAAAIAMTIFYFIYHPKHPSFSLSSLSFPSLNLTSTVAAAAPSSTVDISFSVKNPNTKLLTFVYSSPVKVLISSEGVDLGNGSFPGFVSRPRNVTVIEGVIDGSNGQDPVAVARLRGDVEKKKGFPVVATVETNVKVKVGKVKSMGLGIRVICDGIKGFAPTTTKAVATGKGRNGTAAAVVPGVAATEGVKCKVKLRIKIWKITL